ncbi:hypothetical protein BY996DRAFT_4589528 [Phakopsora pachyrhizi]|nr:hypothetical protein BY996DRAFT_4592048 [Phakopsora pachyrhizi]KAI8449245.1 hypothetical protein BY996DRAFT_4589528 [Phakopsora pachyrhizi]
MPLYLGVEFEDRGNSRFVHGSRPWREMRIKFGSRPTNPQELLCPVERCRCVILKGGVGKLISRMKCPLPRTDQTAEKSYTSCWLVNRPTSFENVGFSKPIEQQNNQESQEFRPIQTRWLSCGACDFGPIGWTESSGDLAKQFIKDPEGSFSNVSFLIDCQRVYTIKS